MTRNQTLFRIFLASFLALTFQATGQAKTAPLKVGKVLHGFTLVKRQALPEIDAVGLLFEHKKSGAKLVKFESKDPNKAFVIAFATPPPDDAGLPHILEHSVLNGSRKFPVKSPFDVLRKGSLNTFLNAMTADDWTMYPIASTNAKDFFNLMDVYLDAVLYPRIHTEPRILKQEGWRYELESADAPLKYNGVVYNEMKGAFSSPERLLNARVQQNLFPDTPYGRVAGGLPEAIPELTAEQFLNFHKTYYHPSNARITLWGDGDTAAELKFIHENYLRDFKAKKIDAAFPLQKPFDKLREVEAAYPVASKEDTQNKTFLALGWSAGSPTEPVLSMALDVLSDVLVNRTASPLRQALEKAGVGKNVSAWYDGMHQGVLAVNVSNAKAGDAQRFRKLVFESLQQQVDKGLDRRLVEGVINRLEFRLREADFRSLPTGLVYAYVGLRGWMFADDPFLGVAYEQSLAKLRELSGNGGLEKLIQTHLLDNKHAVLVILSPKPGLEEENNKRIAEKLASIKAKMSKAEIEKIVIQTKELKAWQKAKDKPEDLATIPMLTLDDLDKKEPAYTATEHKIAGLRVLHAEQNTKGIIYLKLMFDTRAVPPELQPHLELLNALLGEVDTLDRSYADLDAEMNIHTGGIFTGLQVYTNVHDDKSYLPVLGLSGKALSPKLDELLSLSGEMLLHSRFEDKARIKDVLNKLWARYESMARNSGVSLAISRLLARISPAAAFSERTEGLGFIQILGPLMKAYDKRADDLLADLGLVASLVFDKNNLIVGVTCPAEDFETFKSKLPKLLTSMPAVERKAQREAGILKVGNEGLQAASKVQYVIQGGSFREQGKSYDGLMSLAGRVMSRDYLQQKVRVQGGAYGAWASFDRSGTMYFGSYRDPNLAKTLDAYKGVVDFLKGFAASEREMTRYIIGAIGGRDRPLTPSMRGTQAFSNILRQLDQAELQKEREQILAAKPSDIQALAPVVEAVLKQNKHCIYGNEKKLEENKKLFDKLLKVLN